jgi:Leucine-rich repeat (LRR) protein
LTRLQLSAIPGSLPACFNRLVCLKVIRGLHDPAHLALVLQASQNLSSLQRLDLSHTYMSDVGFEALAGALRDLSGLRHLDLSFNRIGVVGAAALAGALRDLSGLQLLDLSHNAMGDVGLAELAHALFGRSGTRQHFELGNLGIRLYNTLLTLTKAPCATHAICKT